MRRIRALGFVATVTVGILALATPAGAGPPDAASLVANIRSGDDTSSSSPGQLTTIGNTVFFTADDGMHGTELWKSDGTGAAMVKDINTNPSVAASSNPAGLAAMGGVLYFSADDGTHGAELWRSDGTEAGTTMVKDIRNISNLPGSPVLLTPIGNTLFFSANDGVDGRQLWKTDGTEPGTQPVGAINPPGGSNPDSLSNVGGKLFFAATNTSGTALYTSDGGAPIMVSGSDDTAPHGITAVGNTAFFAADDGTHGVELWKSDGTTASQVEDIYPGGDSSPTGLTTVGDTLFFRADDGTHGPELWKTDGSTATMVKDINPGGGPFPIELINLNGVLLFQGRDDDHGVELWRSDGTPGGTVMVKDINLGAGDSYPGRPTEVGDYVVFEASATGLSPLNSELWRTDGTAGGTALVQDINPAAGGLDTSPPPQFAVLGPAVLFGADDGVNGVELWKAVDTIAPDTTIDSGPAEASTILSHTPSFGFSSDDPPSSFQCSVDGDAFAACASPQTTVTLSAGAHSFSVRATDAAGNVDPTPASRTFTINDPASSPPTDTPTNPASKPSNQFTIGKAKRNVKKGTAKLPVDVPGAGVIVLAAKNVKSASKTATGASEVLLKIKTKGALRDRLKAKGKAKVSVQVTFTPTGGDANAQSRRVKLKLKT